LSFRTGSEQSPHPSTFTSFTHCLHDRFIELVYPIDKFGETIRCQRKENTVVKKIVAGVFVAAMIAALVIGIMRLMNAPAQAQGGSGRWVTDEDTTAWRGNGGRGGQSAGQATASAAASAADEEAMASLQQASGQGRGYGAQGNQGGGGQGQGGQGQAGQGQGGQGQAGQGQGGTANATGEPQAELEEWVTIEGTVLQTLELVVETEGGETVQVGLGPSHYRDAQGFVLNVDDRVRISGYWEDGEFKAGEVENVTSGDTIVLRDAYGRPLWSGRGRGSS
jgi:hypothetical protein